MAGVRAFKLTAKGGLTGIYDVRGAVVFEGELPPLP